MSIIWNVISALSGAAFCKVIAQKNGRDEKRAILWGLLFGLLAVLVYLCMGKKEDCGSNIKTS